LKGKIFFSVVAVQFLKSNEFISLLNGIKVNCFSVVDSWFQNIWILLSHGLIYPDALNSQLFLNFEAVKDKLDLFTVLSILYLSDTVTKLVGI
jgi:hypothetical protein